MALQQGQQLELTVEKPAAGGRMIARHGGQVILVLGAIPGERVLARVDRVERQVAFAATVEVLQRSADRRDPGVDLLCGGCVYAHMAYPCQVALKAEVIRDAFGRLGRIPLDAPPAVAESPESHYRMRARFHVRAGRAGFYREGTHDLCDAAPTRQLRDEAIASATEALASLERSGCPVTSLELAENLAGDQRAIHVTPAEGITPTDAALEAAQAAGGLTGCSAAGPGRPARAAGVPVVGDPLTALTAGRAVDGVLERHAASFFQANRFLLPRLVSRVIDEVRADGDVLDLYAGVGLFAVSLASCGRHGITAVEGDRSSARDLQRNAAARGAAIRVWIGGVEEFFQRRRESRASTIVVDPPRTGISRDAMGAVVAHGAGRVIYVSCDPATMARDARRLLDAGYQLRSLEAFDLFPNTPHVESLAVFER